MHEINFYLKIVIIHTIFFSEKFSHVWTINGHRENNVKLLKASAFPSRCLFCRKIYWINQSNSDRESRRRMKWKCRPVTALQLRIRYKWTLLILGLLGMLWQGTGGHEACYTKVFSSENAATVYWWRWPAHSLQWMPVIYIYVQPFPTAYGVLIYVCIGMFIKMFQGFFDSWAGYANINFSS